MSLLLGWPIFSNYKNTKSWLQNIAKIVKWFCISICWSSISYFTFHNYLIIVKLIVWNRRDGFMFLFAWNKFGHFLCAHCSVHNIKQWPVKRNRQKCCCQASYFKPLVKLNPGNANKHEKKLSLERKLVSQLMHTAAVLPVARTIRWIL